MIKIVSTTGETMRSWEKVDTGETFVFAGEKTPKGEVFIRTYESFVGLSGGEHYTGWRNLPVRIVQCTMTIQEN